MNNNAGNHLVAEIRDFNRYYTNILGLLNQNIYNSGYTLTEARVLYEIGHCKTICTANQLIESLSIDGGYLSRILKRFETCGLLTRERCSHDARSYQIILTLQGHQVLDELDHNSNHQISNLINHLSDNDCRDLFAAINLIRNKLDPQTDFTIRSFTPADIEYVISRHQILYAIEHNFDATFARDVTKTVRQFSNKHDPRQENLWIAESHGVQVGWIALVKVNKTTAQLRWFLLEPYVRGQGLGMRLINTALDFARHSAYQEVFLWTVDILKAARQLYGRCGLNPVETAEHDIWGQHLTEEKWALHL